METLSAFKIAKITDDKPIKPIKKNMWIALFPHAY